MTAMLINCLFVGAGGFIGSVLRYILGYLAPASQTGFPYITLLVNAIGAFAVAFIVTFFTREQGASNLQLLLFLQVGICGGFTTYSAFSFEGMELIQKGDIALATLYIGSSLLVCLGLAFAGQAFAKSL